MIKKEVRKHPEQSSLNSYNGGMSVCKLKEIAAELQTIKARVEWLYSYIPESIISDEYLLKDYGHFWSTKNKEGSITRMGRRFRQLHKGCTSELCIHGTPSTCFRRDEDAAIRANQFQTLMLNELGYET